MPFFFVNAKDMGTEQTLHLTPFKSGKCVTLFEDVQQADAALRQLPTGSWKVKEVKDLLPWYSALSQAGVTHVCEVASGGEEHLPKNIHLLISNLRTSGTLDAF